MGRPISQFKVDMSHQEMERILEELQQLCEQTPGIWISAEAGARWLCHDQGYEDMAEFEDALHGTFEDFLQAMPHIETKIDEKNRLVFRLKEDPPRDQWQGKKMTLRITDSADLWRVLSKSQYATVEIPEMEFEISADGKRKIDSLYNHICCAVWNLGQHVNSSGAGMVQDHKRRCWENRTEVNVSSFIAHGARPPVSVLEGQN
ncbi:hypothetical protein DUNSADRAFT_14608 [Dunaliella salina]|uniref:Uncharacterized protein n=1 Tax=Dunaliella salina TaxID=3046 RepID=A0ABQ7H2H0_DUNSA|nr:hypothetical protein DUNSADRAFT_14608 [Dunaliella salina]|eukprot:KAF5841050.1 hypothetical protein DUNSADRAFT_14608 [Dunaliella salina]